MQPHFSSIDETEIAHFNALARQWWDQEGPLQSLHQLNPPRLKFMRDHICRHFEIPQDHLTSSPLRGLTLLDVGCGGGLLTEPLARLGANVTGIDAAGENIGVARHHAAQQGLNIEYHHTTVEEVEQKFDIVCALEIIEHVPDVESFIAACCKRVKPGGLFFLSTLNRTWKSFMLGIVAAEYLLRWVPKGTHQWHKFVSPEELAHALAPQNFHCVDTQGLYYHPLYGEWHLKKEKLGVNYITCAKEASSGVEIS